MSDYLSLNRSEKEKIFQMGLSIFFFPNIWINEFIANNCKGRIWFVFS